MRITLPEERRLIKKLSESYQNGQSIMVENYVAGDIIALVDAVQEACARAVERGLDLSGTDFRGNGLLRAAAREIREHLYDA